MGCGTITSNLMMVKINSKQLSMINAFIGCNSNLIAPVTVGAKLNVAWQVQLLPDDVNDEAFAIARARQVNKEGYAKVLEEKRNKKGK